MSKQRSLLDEYRKNQSPSDQDDHVIENSIEAAAERAGWNGLKACLASHWGTHSETKCNLFAFQYGFDGYYDKDEVRTAHAEGRIVEWLETTLVQAQILGELRR